MFLYAVGSENTKEKRQTLFKHMIFRNRSGLFCLILKFGRRFEYFRRPGKFYKAGAACGEVTKFQNYKPLKVFIAGGGKTDNRF